MNNVLEAYQSRPRRWWKTLLVTIIVAIILAWSGSSIEFEGIASKGSEVAYGIVHGIANPDLDLLFGTKNTDVPYLLLETVAIAFLGTIFGGILAVPFSFLASGNIVPDTAHPHDPEPCVGACVDPRDRAGRVLRRGDAVHLLHRHDQQDVHHRH